jgi:hypothetical protein
VDDAGSSPGMQALAEPLTAILVLCFTKAPFWPVIVVGITRLVPQRLPFALAGNVAASAEFEPCGSGSSNELAHKPRQVAHHALLAARGAVLAVQEQTHGGRPAYPGGRRPPGYAASLPCGSASEHAEPFAQRHFSTPPFELIPPSSYIRFRRHHNSLRIPVGHHRRRQT